ncbi:MAG: murein biosynthesis integral membrane protein MurJ [Actinobacteria bacterium]|nr:MAG: murein biosynthesis integral membrane protein MurJ [Actinomycetota bacterium]
MFGIASKRPAVAGAPMVAEALPILVRVDERTGRRLAWSTAIFSLATGISRILGLVREVVAAYYFGAYGRINAFTVAFQVPNLIRALVADAALSSAFVPVFTELLEKGDRKRAWRVASSLFWLMLLGLGGLTALFIVIAPWVLKPFGDPGGDAELAVTLSRILFPIVVLLGVSGIVVGILNSYEEFAIPALTPVFWNLAIIAGLVIGVPRANTVDTKLYVYAGSIVIGTVIQVLLPFPWLRGLDGRLTLVLDWRDPAVWQVLKLMVPVTLGLGLINFNAVVDSAFASRLIDPKLSPTAIDKAFRLYMLPQGMFSVAIATVLFPSLARLAARNDMPAFRSTVSLGLRQIAFLLIPAGVVCAVLAQPITRLVYQRGAWGPHATAVTAGALAAFSGGLAFNGAMLMLNRAFFSLQSNWIPTYVALGNLGLNAALDAVFYRFGTWGIPLSTTVVNIAGTGVLLILLRRRLHRIDFGAIAAAVARIAVASAALAVASFGVWYGLDQLLGRSFGGQLISVAAALSVGLVVYFFACRALGVREMDALLALRERFKRA